MAEDGEGETREVDIVASVDIDGSTYRLLLGLAAVAGVWLTVHGLVASIPAGNDVMAHVARTDHAFHLFREGRLDGWFPTFGSGYRQFAVYGQGLPIASGLVRAASLGQISTARSLAMLGSLSIALVPVGVATLSRELGSTRLAAAIHGALGLCVSFPFAGGLAALYGIGLVPAVMAVPLQTAVAAGALRTVRTGSRRAMAATALGVGFLLLLHPISLLVLAVMVPGLLFALPRLRLANLASLVLTGAWGAAMATFWLWPAWQTRDLRGGISAWGTPPLSTRAADVLRGETLVPQLVAIAALVAIALVAGEATRSVAGRRALAAPATAVVYLVVAHLAAGHRWEPLEVSVQFANRGLVLAAFLLLLPLARVLGQLVGALGTRHHRLVPAAIATVVVVAIGAPVLLPDGLDPPQTAPRPTDDLSGMARTVRYVVPPARRHLLVDPGPFVELGTSEPARWLAVVSQRPTAHLYFPEATTNPAAGLLPDRVLDELTPESSLGRLRRAGITHIVVTAAVADELDHEPGYLRVANNGALSLFEIQPERGAPVVAAMLQPDEQPIRPVGFSLDAALRERDDEALAWDVRAADTTDVVMPIASDPDWHVTVDGRPVATHTTGEELLGFEVPKGRHRVEARFTGSRNQPLAILVSLVAIGGALWVLVSPWVRGRGGRRAVRRPPRRSDPSSA